RWSAEAAASSRSLPRSPKNRLPGVVEFGVVVVVESDGAATVTVPGKVWAPDKLGTATRAAATLPTPTAVRAAIPVTKRLGIMPSSYGASDASFSVLSLASA